MVFYRKYRPQTIAELDSREIRDKLIAVLGSKDIPHAFLFTGPKGLGKTSTARIIAKVVNCERLASSKIASSSETKEKLNAKRYTLDANVEPCNKCDECVSITNGTNMDIFEIDAASNRGIDEIRDLREKIRLMPVKAKKKVYIIDEVHMLTTEAFNALLKTIEEPPSHALFILCTTEPHKVPATIISRCFHISFKLATEEELTRSFKRMAKDENLEIDDEALKYLSSLSDGSFRDGAKILEEVGLMSGGSKLKITKEIVEEKYQTSNIKYQINELLGFLKEKKTKEGLKLISELVKQGVDLKYFVEQMIGELHGELLSLVLDLNKRTGPAASQPQNFPTVRQWRTGPHSGVPRSVSPVPDSPHLSLNEIKQLIELFSKAHGEMKYAVLQQLPVEILVIEYCQNTNNELLPEAEAQKKAEPNTEQHGSEVQEKSAGESTKDRTHLPGDSAAVHLEGGATGDRIDKKMEKIDNDKDGLDLLKLVIDKIKSLNYSLAGVLRSCSLKKTDEKEVIIEAGYKFHKEKLEERKAFSVLEKAVQDILGSDVEVLIKLKDGK